MYNKNALMRNVLITPAEVIFHAPTKHTIDPRMIGSSIIVAEERFIVPELGYDLYEALVTAKNQEVTALNLADMNTKVAPDTVVVGDLVNALEYLSDPYKKFWKNHLWKIVAECVLVAAFPEGFVQFGSEGAFHNSPPAGLMVTSGFVTPLASSMKWAIDKKVKDRIDPLLQSMHNYLCKNQADFALYGKLSQCPQCQGDTTNQLKYTGLALGIYDEIDGEDNTSCCNEKGW